MLQVNDHIREFGLGDDLLLYSGACGSIFSTNPMSALIWKGLKEGLTCSDLADLLCQAYDIPSQQVENDLAKLVSQWLAHGLLAWNHHSTMGCRRPDKAPEPAVAYPGPIPRLGSNSVIAHYRLLDFHIHLRLPGVEEARLVHPMLNHLESTASESGNLHIEVRHGSNGYQMMCDGTPIDWCADKCGLAPMVHANLHLLAYERCDHLTGLHAAAVAYKNHAILFPAGCGSGKSTLTAALVASGFQYCADDMVFLTDRPVLMRPAPLAMGIKSGSWQLLEKFYPQLPTIASHERADGKVVRYLPPPHSTFRPAADTLAVSHIIFPGYREGATAALVPLTPAQGLCRIAQAGYAVRGGLTESCVEQLVTWICDIPCYEFCYGDLEGALDVLKRFLR
jgi:hypothetical protein